MKTRVLFPLLACAVTCMPVWAQTWAHPTIIARPANGDEEASVVVPAEIRVWGGVLASQTTSAVSDPNAAAEEVVDALVTALRAQFAAGLLERHEAIIHLIGVGEADAKSLWSEATELVHNSADAFQNPTTALDAAYASAYTTVDSSRQDEFESLFTNVTPWMDTGSAETLAWAEAFANQYKIRTQNDPNLAPADANNVPAFIFDCEAYARRFPVTFESGGVDTEPTAVHTDTHSLYAYWLALANDARFDTTDLVGFAANTTLEDEYEAFKDLYDDAFPSHGGSYPPHPSLDPNQNLFFETWWRGFTRELVDRALDASVYAPIKTAFPQARMGNYMSSMRTDLAHAVDWDAGAHCPSPGGSKVYYWEGASGNSQHPIVYSYASDCDSDPNEYLAGFMGRTRDRIEACTDSFDYNDGMLGADVTPFVTPVGTDTKSTGATMTEEATRQTFALFRAKGITSFVLYHWSTYIDDPNGVDLMNAAYANTVSLVDQVWSNELISVIQNLGTNSDGDIDSLAFSDGDTYNYSSTALGNLGRVSVRFDTGYDPNDSVDVLRVHYELTVNQLNNVDIDFEMRDFTSNTWKEIESLTVTNGDTLVGYIDVDASTDDFIDEADNNRVRVRLDCDSTAAFSIEIDLLQLVDATPLP